MSYFEIGIYHGKKDVNIGTLWRSAMQLGASGVFTVGRRYTKQASDTYHAINNLPVRQYKDFDDFNKHRPIGTILVGIEMGGIPLVSFSHPKCAIYLLGAEDHGLPKNILDKCNTVISLDSVARPSYNVAVAGSIVMYHRLFL